MHVRSMLAAGSAVLLSAGLTLTGVSAAGASTHRGAHRVAPPKISSLPWPVSGQQRSGHQVGGPVQVKYTNWSGYADSGSGEKYTKVSSSFTQPAVTCDPKASGYQVTVFWDGIDGFSNGRVEQGGTEAYCFNGQGPFYDTWWEEFPVNLIQDVGTTVKAGDKIAVSVVRKGTKYTVKVTDSTTAGNSFTHGFSCAAATCPDASAEWIAEAPGNTAGGLYPLVKFAKWTNSKSAVANAGTTGTIKTFPDDEITMVNNSGQVKAKPSALNAAGNTFSVTYKRSS
jgi:hypothetical protein